MISRVALIDMKKHKDNSLSVALKLLGGISKLNRLNRDVILKVGIYSTNSDHHTTVNVTDQIIKAFDKARKIYLTESDSYNGTGTERLQLWKKLFSDRVIPYNLSEDDVTQPVKINTEVKDLTLNLPERLFKPRIFVTTHVLRTYSKGSVLKNLFGLVPMVEKAKFHKNEIFNTMLPDITEAIGGIDLAVLDGTYLHEGVAKPVKARTDILVVGTDAVAVETLGYKLLGMNPYKLATIQSFVRRGLGVGEFDDIEVLGESFATMKERVAGALSKAKEKMADQPRRWSPSLAASLLIRSGFFKLPNTRTIEDVLQKMEFDDPRSVGKKSEIIAVLRRRMKMKVLQGEKGSSGWTFCT